MQQFIEPGWYPQMQQETGLKLENPRCYFFGNRIVFKSSDFKTEFVATLSDAEMHTPMIKLWPKIVNSWIAGMKAELERMQIIAICDGFLGTAAAKGGELAYFAPDDSEFDGQTMKYFDAIGNVVSVDAKTGEVTWLQKAGEEE